MFKQRLMTVGQEEQYFTPPLYEVICRGSRSRKKVKTAQKNPKKKP